MTDRQLLATLSEGTGLSVFHDLLWDVVMRLRDGKIEYLVTEARPEGKPVKVYGPVRDRDDAVDWAKFVAEVFRIEKCQTIPDWPY